MQEQTQPTISVVNKYGFISGGCIADMLDRAALCHVNKLFPDTTDMQLYTVVLNVSYKKQLCAVNGVRFISDHRVLSRTDQPFEITVLIELWQDDTLIADALVRFKQSQRNYCESKLEK